MTDMPITVEERLHPYLRQTPTEVVVNIAIAESACRQHAAQAKRIERARLKAQFALVCGQLEEVRTQCHNEQVWRKYSDSERELARAERDRLIQEKGDRDIAWLKLVVDARKKERAICLELALQCCERVTERNAIRLAFETMENSEKTQLPQGLQENGKEQA